MDGTLNSGHKVIKKPKYDEKILYHFLDKSSSLKLSGLVSSTFSGQISNELASVLSIDRVALVLLYLLGERAS